MRWLTIALKIILAATLSLVALIIVIVAGLQTRLGQDWLTAAVNHAMSGTLQVSGLGGGVPWNMTIAAIDLRDPDGIWGRVDDVGLKLRPADLLRRRLTIQSLEARRIRVDREPLPAAPAQQREPSGPPHLPIAVDLRRLDIASIELAPPILGAAAKISLQGDARLQGSGGDLHLVVDRTDGQPGHMKAAVGLSGQPARLMAAVDIEEPTGQLLNALLSRNDNLPLTAALDGEGPFADWHGHLAAQAGDGGRLVADMALSDRDGYHAAVDGELAAPSLLPAAAAAAIGNEARFHLAGAETPDGGVTIDGIELRMDAANLTGSGSVGAGTDGPVAAKLRVDVEDIGKLSSLLGRPAAGSATLGLTAAGTRGRPSVAVTAEGHGVRLADRGVDNLTAQFTAEAAGAIEDPQTRIVFSAEGRFEGITATELPSPPQAIGWRAFGASTADGSAIDIKSFAVDGPGVTLTSTGTADRRTRAASAAIHVEAADLSRLAAVAGRKLAGSGALDAVLSRQETGNARVRIDGKFRDLVTGIPMADGLLGGRLAVDIDGDRADNGDVTVRMATIDAANLHATGQGSTNAAGGRAEGRFAVSLPRLDVLSAPGRPVAGRAQLDGTLSGSARAPHLDAVLTADEIKAGAMRLDRLVAQLQATKEANPAGSLNAEFRSGRLAGTLDGRAAVAPDGKTFDLSRLHFAAGGTTLDAALWSALDTHLTNGTIEAHSADLSELSSLVGVPLSGSFDLDGKLANERGQALAFRFSATKLGFASATAAPSTVERINASGRLSDLFGDVRGSGDVAILGANSGGASVDRFHASVSSRRAGALAFTASMQGKVREPVELAVAGSVDIARNAVAARITRLDGKLGDQALRLDQPLRLAKSGEDVSVSGLRLELGSGQLQGAALLKRNAVMAKLAAKDVPLALAEAFTGKGSAGGVVSAEVDLRGPLERPTGTIGMTAHGLRLATARHSDLPPLDITAAGRLQPGRLGITGRVAAAKGEEIDFAGAAPISFRQRPFGASLPPDGALSMRIRGDGRLESLADLLPIGEDRLSGHYHLDVTVGGTVARPDASGHVTIDHGRYESLPYGTVLDALKVDVEGDRDRVVLRQFDATDGGKGTLALGGTVLPAVQGGPAFDATLSLHNFQLVHRDDAVAHGSGDLHLLGTLAEPKVIARLKIDKAQISLAERLPPSVRKLDVTVIDSATGQVISQPAPPSTKPPIVAALDIKVDIPGQVFVRGRGLDSEWKGHFDIGGTSAAPDIRGSLDVVNGTMNFLGKTLDLTRGTITLAGGNKVEPLIDFLAQSNSAQVRAQVVVTGPAENPTIKLTSDPPMPQDQVLSQLLFGQDVSQLSPLEGLQIAQAAAEMASGGTGVVDRIRMKFGLDRLSIGSPEQTASAAAPAGTGATSNSRTSAGGALGNTTVSAGKYVAPGVYLGVDQGVSGQTQAKVEVEITRSLTVNATESAGQGTGVGVNWKLDY